ncbi:hypothetical protein [Aeromonas media]|uniref:hypothetical protein n=1 Tax=Aeromonas media TaxID=651 RepID=UPI003D07CA04
MKSRAFRKLMYHFCEALGEADTHSDHKKEHTNRDSFELHAQLIDHDLPRAIELLAKNSQSPLEMFSHTVFIWNLVCDELLFNPIITLGSDDEIDESYIKNCLIPLLAVQILRIGVKDDRDNAETFCKHIIHFFIGEYISNNGPKKHCFYHAAKKFLRKYIDNLIFECTDPISDIIKAINSIKTGSSLRAITIKQHFKLSKQMVRSNSSIHQSKYNDWDAKLDKLEIAYIAISAVLYFEKKTHLCINLLEQFKKLQVTNDDNIDGLFSALADAYDQHHQNNDPKSTVRPLVQWLYENNYNNTLPSKIFELPPNLMNCITALGSFLYPYSLQSINQKRVQLFNISAQEETFEAAKNEKYGNLFSPYPLLINTLYCIQKNELYKALDIIETNYSIKHSRFGFHPYAFAMLYIGLAYKLRKIQHNKLERLLADYNDNIGVNNLILTESFSLGRVVSEDDYYKHSIYSPITPTFNFNQTLISALSTYNLTAIKLDASQYCNVHKITEPGPLMPFAVHAPQPNRDILAKLERVAGKLLSGLPYLTGITNPKLFIDTIVEKKILTRSELNDNLIKHVKRSMLSICLLDYENLIAHLSLPGGRHNNIVTLGRNSVVVKLLLDAMLQQSIS